MKKVSYILNIFFAGFFFWYFGIHIGVSYYFQKYALHREFFFDDPYYQAKVNSYREVNNLLDPKKKYIVMAGDSLIEQFPVSDFFLGYNILNRAIGRDTSHGLLTRLEENINNINVSIAFVMIGHNDFKYNMLQETKNNIKDLLLKINADQKIFLSILPEDNPGRNKTVELLNVMIKEFCYDNGFKFIDLYSLFIKRNYHIREMYYYDGVHLNISGYKLIYNKLLPIISQYTSRYSELNFERLPFRF